MYDSGKIIIGIIIFVIVFATPILFNLGGSEIEPSPNIVYPVSDTPMECIHSKEYMRNNHMDLLNEWRDEVVRNEIRTYIAPSGKKFEMSMSGTCISCHSNKDTFCDECHDYLGVDPYCWDCHVEPSKVEAE
jgi:hypothetical protein